MKTYQEWMEAALAAVQAHYGPASVIELWFVTNELWDYHAGVTRREVNGTSQGCVSFENGAWVVQED